MWPKQKKNYKRYALNHLTPHQLAVLLNVHQRITNWFQEVRKKTNGPTLPPSRTESRTLDLTGRSKRKKPPYQLHQAYSILHWKPQDSPLRREVQDLWERRNEDSVRETLKPFLGKTAQARTKASEKLVFHVAVMRWKCSLLNPAELATLQDWINKQQKARQKARTLPWSAEGDEYGDKQSTENTYIQGCVTLIPPTETES